MAILICEAICRLILFSPDPLQISRGPQAPQRLTDFDDQQRSWELRRHPLLQDELVPLVVSEGLSVDAQLLCAIFQPEARVWWPPAKPTSRKPLWLFWDCPSSSSTTAPAMVRPSLKIMRAASCPQNPTATLQSRPPGSALREPQPWPGTPGLLRSYPPCRRNHFRVISVKQHLNEESRSHDIVGKSYQGTTESGLPV